MKVDEPSAATTKGIGEDNQARRQAQILVSVKWGCLACICCIAFACRVFSVLRFESVIHEFDPYFNYRTSKFLQEKGFVAFWNWFDERAWYPLGRVVGQTLFPGLMITANVLWLLCDSIGIKLDLREICVFTAPVFAMGTALATYGLTKITTNNTAAGLIAALIIAVCPSYLSRSTAGGFDNEAIAIFTLVLSFYTFIRACKAGTLGSIVVACLAYFYMVLVWGGYVFITNTVAGYVVAVLAMNRMDMKMFTAYTAWYVLGTLWSFNIPFVGVAAVRSAEHLSSHVAFVVLICWYLLVHPSMTKFRQNCLGRWFAAASSSAMTLMISFLVLSGLAAVLVAKGAAKFSGRSMTLLDPSYATKNVPIIASISEHQPTTWSVFHSELGPGFVLSPLGIFLALSDGPNQYKWFLGVFATLAGYFSAVMIRLNLVLAPAHAAVVGLACSEILLRAVAVLKSVAPAGEKQSSGARMMAKYVSAFLVTSVLFLSYRLLTVGMFSAAALYSNPSIVTAATLRNGDRLIIDDLREAFQWINQNTFQDAKLMSWWDYGYQAAEMADRGVIVDNNTWNTTHIATVGLALSSDEETAYHIMSHLDVDYVFVLFGGVTRYSGDDLNKFVWISRIASREFPDLCPTEVDFMSPYTGNFDVGQYAAPALKNSLLYRLSYHQFANNAQTDGRDILRQGAPEIPNLEKPLKWLEEVYTTTSYMLRIYKVKKSPQRPTLMTREKPSFLAG